MLTNLFKAAAVALPLALALGGAATAQPAPTPFSLTFTFVNINQTEPIITGVMPDGTQTTTRIATNIGWLMNDDGQWFGNQMGATCRALQRFVGTQQVEARSNCTFVDRDGDMLFELIIREAGATRSTGQFTGGTGKYAGVVSEPFIIVGFPALGRTLDGYSVSAGNKTGTYTGGTPPAPR